MEFPSEVLALTFATGQGWHFGCGIFDTASSFKTGACICWMAVFYRWLLSQANHSRVF